MNENKAVSGFLETAELYYSRLLGADENLFARDRKKPTFFYSPLRNTVMQGYGEKFDLLAIKTVRSAFFSYGDAVNEKIPVLKELLDTGVSFCGAIGQVFKKEPLRSFIYYYSGDMPETASARPLESADYPAFERFFLESNPGADDISWLFGYFEEMVAERLCCGVFEDGLLVSCADSPEVPFMRGFVREIGVSTLEKYRRRGYAKAACACAVREILKQKKSPVWSTGAKNVPSQKLAAALGFELFGEVFSVSADGI